MVVNKIKKLAPIITSGATIKNIIDRQKGFDIFFLAWININSTKRSDCFRGNKEDKKPEKGLCQN